MAFIFPTRTTASSVADHVADHNLLASLLERAGGFTASSSKTAHLTEHNAIHSLFSLPTRSSGDSAALHLTDSQTMYADIVTVYSGVRGTVGPRTNASIAEYPGSFDSSHSTFSSLQSAVNAGGTGRKFQITASMAFTATIQPHASDEFWGDGASIVITRSGTVHDAIKPTGSVNGVKVMNLKFSGFDDNSVSNNPGAVHANGNDSWEIGYCEFTLNGLSWSLGDGGTGSRVHHSYMHGNGVNALELNVCYGALRTFNATIEDNEITDGGKIIQTTSFTWRHNYVHDVGNDGSNRMGLWFDTQTIKSVVEWNKFIDNYLGAHHESCSKRPPTDTVLTTAVDLNHIRYNLFQGSTWEGYMTSGSRYIEIYYNVFKNNLVTGNTGEIALNLRADQPPSGYDLDHNYIHHNYISPSGTTKRAVYFNANVANSADYYTNNGKNNNWDYNTYNAATVDTGTNQFWVGANKTWTQFLTIPQGTEGGGATMELHGERS